MKFNKFLNLSTPTIGKASFILAISVLISHLLGLLRDRFLAQSFGAGQSLDIYFAAFRIPDLVYNILFAGSIIVSFLPLFSEYYKKNKNEAWEMVNYVLNGFLIFFFALILILFIFAPNLINLMVPGFSPEAKEMCVLLTRIMFLSPLFLGISSLFSSILHYFGKFLAYSLAPIFYNLGIIFGILVLAPKYGILGVAIGVVLGAFLHLLIQIPPVKSCGFKYLPKFNLKYPAIFKLFKLAIFRTIAAASSQINFIVITFFASIIGEGAISIFNFSNNLRYFPIGIIGVSVASATFPLLSKNFEKKEFEKFFSTFTKNFCLILFLSLPVSALFFIFKEEIVKIIFWTGAFGIQDVKLTSLALGAFSISIFAQCLVPLILRGFFSLKDTKTPTFVALALMVLNIILCFTFVNFIFSDSKIFGLTLAFSIGLLIEFFILFYLFYKKVGNFGTKQILNSGIKILLATILTAIFSFLLKILLIPENAGILSIFLNFLLITILAIIFYFFASFIFKVKELKYLNLPRKNIK